MKKSTQFILGAVLLIASPSVWAIGDAGCGLGSLAITKNTKLSQSLAVTTNGTFSNQLFGITSGTSNCNASSLVMREKEANYYAEANFEGLKVDMARGQGESLTAFAQILGCNDAAIGRLGEVSRSHYSKIVPESGTSPGKMVEAIRSEISQDSGLKQSCSSTTQVL